MKRLILGLIVFSLVFLIGASGCGGYNTAQTPTAPSATTPETTVVTPPVAPETAQTSVTISGFAFNPAEITVKAGDTVKWTNQDSVPHRVVSDTGAFEGIQMNQGGTYSFTFTSAGTYAYHCAIHPSMKGTVIVQ